jgi:hypothetical protein
MRRIEAQREADRQAEERAAAAAERERLLKLEEEQAKSNLIWQFQNNYPSTVVVTFYSQDHGDGWIGPHDDNGERGWAVPSGKRERIPISCHAGERICYGAWVRGNFGDFWGVGPRNQNACQECIGPGNRVGCNFCCYTCGSGATRWIGLDASGDTSR